MSYSKEMEKQQIYVSEKLAASLKRDAVLFEFLHKDQLRLNFNRFLTKLLVGYADGYLQEVETLQTRLETIFDGFLPGEGASSELIRQLMSEFGRPNAFRSEGKNIVRLSLKPTAASVQVLSDFRERIGNDVSFSNGLRDLFASYAAKPFHERERILFRDNVEFLEAACQKHSSISFRLYTNPDCIHHVVPYELTHGPEEMFNYLIGQEYNPNSKKMEARSYRLCRIITPSRHVPSEPLEEKIVEQLELMKKHGPQYVITQENEVCVRLSEKGLQAFRMIYLGRPKEYRIVPQQDGSALCYLNGPSSQIVLYFRRFAADEAEILYPSRLRNSLRRFHEKGVRVYSSRKNNSL